MTPRKDEQEETKPPTPSKRGGERPATKGKPAPGTTGGKPGPGKDTDQKKGGARVGYQAPDEDEPELGGGTDQFLTR